MNKVIAVLTLSLAVVFSGFAQSNDLKGPKYKNAKPSTKYEGNTSVLVKENPNQFQGPERKNFNPRNYQIEVVDAPQEFEMPKPDLVVSTENKSYETVDQKEAVDQKEKIIYKRVKTEDMKGKNTKGLKGPAYKNYKP